MLPSRGKTLLWLLNNSTMQGGAFACASPQALESNCHQNQTPRFPEYHICACVYTAYNEFNDHSSSACRIASLWKIMVTKHIGMLVLIIEKKICFGSKTLDPDLQCLAKSSSFAHKIKSRDQRSENENINSSCLIFSQNSLNSLHKLSWVSHHFFRHQWWLERLYFEFRDQRGYFSYHH